MGAALGRIDDMAHHTAVYSIRHRTGHSRFPVDQRGPHTGLITIIYFAVNVFGGGAKTLFTISPFSHVPKSTFESIVSKHQ